MGRLARIARGGQSDGSFRSVARIARQGGQVYQPGEPPVRKPAVADNATPNQPLPQQSGSDTPQAAAISNPPATLPSGGDAGFTAMGVPAEMAGPMPLSVPMYNYGGPTDSPNMIDQAFGRDGNASRQPAQPIENTTRPPGPNPVGTDTMQAAPVANPPGGHVPVGKPQPRMATPGMDAPTGMLEGKHQRAER